MSAQRRKARVASTCAFRFTRPACPDLQGLSAPVYKACQSQFIKHACARAVTSTSQSRVAFAIASKASIENNLTAPPGPAPPSLQAHIQIFQTHAQYARVWALQRARACVRACMCASGTYVTCLSCPGGCHLHPTQIEWSAKSRTQSGTWAPV